MEDNQSSRFGKFAGLFVVAFVFVVLALLVWFFVYPPID